MSYTYVARFDVTKNLKFFAIFFRTKQGLRPFLDVAKQLKFFKK
jgi:hypothetical protein